MATNIGPRFSLGQVVATPGALQAFEASGDSPHLYISRHLSLDGGELDKEDRATNEQAVTSGLRILSAFLLSDGTKIWLITEADRSSTCILLPSEY